MQYFFAHIRAESFKTYKVLQAAKWTSSRRETSRHRLLRRKSRFRCRETDTEILVVPSQSNTFKWELDAHLSMSEVTKFTSTYWLKVSQYWEPPHSALVMHQLENPHTMLLPSESEIWSLPWLPESDDYLKIFMLRGFVLKTTWGFY